MSDHTKEPWTFDKYGNTKANGETVRTTGFALSGCKTSIANSRRIVACVNAFEGIPTESIELFSVQALESAAMKIEQQRDELLAALKAYQRAGYGNSTDFRLQGEAYDLSVAAIEKAEKP